MLESGGDVIAIDRDEIPPATTWGKPKQTHKTTTTLRPLKTQANSSHSYRKPLLKASRTPPAPRKIALPHPHIPRLRRHLTVSHNERLRKRRGSSTASSPRIGQLRRHRHRGRLDRLSGGSDEAHSGCESRGELVCGAGGGKGGEEAA